MPDCEKEAIQRLLAMAKESGQADPYVGKRRWKRYHIGMPIEVTSDPTDSVASWQVITHSVSGGGVGFWSKQALAEGESVYVREWLEGTSAVWVPAHVKYCTLGINGYLVGLNFDNPALPDAAYDPMRVPDAAPGAATAGRSRRGRTRMSLASRCACAAAASGCIAASAVVYFVGMFWQPGWPDWFPAVAPGLGVVIGAWIGYFIARGDARLLASIRLVLERMSTGTPPSVSLPEASTQEVEAARQAILSLVRSWKQHADAERTQRNKLEEISQIKTNILSMVSHDLRTPLTSIQLYAQMLQEDLNTLSEADQRHFLGIIAEECMRLARLVDDLLEVQRLEAGKVEWPMRPTDLAQTIQSCARVFAPVAKHNNVQFTLECPESLPEVEVDPDKIAQVINNLLSNALKYTPAESHVALTAEATSKEIMLTVADDGPGIPRDKWDHIFDRFAQLSWNHVREIAGVGLGLYIVRQIVERHHGMVWVDSEVGEGSKFFVSLPLHKPADLPAADPGKQVLVGRVVVCDADPALAAIIAHQLRTEGFDVRVAHSGSRLIEHLTQSEPDVIVTDTALPDMTSRALFDALGSFQPRAFKLVLHSYEGDFEVLKWRGVDVLLRRPASREEMAQAVRVAMHRRSGLGSVVLILDRDDLDVQRLQRAMAAAGHLPLVTREAETIGEWIQEYPIDFVVLPGSELAMHPAFLTKLMSIMEDGPRVLVIGPSAGRKDRREHGGDVVYLQYEPGQEDQVAAEINALRETPLQEAMA